MKRPLLLALALTAVATGIGASIATAAPRSAPVYPCEVSLGTISNASTKLQIRISFNSEPFCQGNPSNTSTTVFFEEGGPMTRDAVLATYAQLITAAREGTPMRVTVSSNSVISSMFFLAGI